jgi:exonuclease SbcD
MRGLHTSDWHLGVCKHGVDRTVDHTHVLAQIKGIAIDEKVDFILHTGDLFEGRNPGIDVLRYAWNVLEELAQIAPLIVLCGNHDGAKYFELFGMVNGGRLPIHFVDPVTISTLRENSIIKLHTAANEIVRIGAVPFIKDESFISSFLAGDTTRSTAMYADRVGQIEQMVGTWLSQSYDPRTDIRIFAAHLLVDGAQKSGSEYAFHVDSEFATYGSRVPPAEYVAFGHIHKPQVVPGVPHGRYAGSPLQIDFGEVRDIKVVYLISGKPGRPLAIEERSLDVGRRLVDIEGTLDEILANAAQYAGHIGRVMVKLEKPVDELSARVRDALPGTIVSQVIPVYARAQAEVITVAAGEREPTLDELFVTYVDRSLQILDAPRVKAYFGELLEKVRAKESGTVLSDVDAALL